MPGWCHSFFKRALKVAAAWTRVRRPQRQFCWIVAQSNKIRVAGSLPPVFGSYEPQRFDPVPVQDHLSVLIEGLSSFVDLWLGETLNLIAEGEAVARAVAGSGRSFWISFTLADDSGLTEPSRLRSGETVADAARWATGSGAGALLFNCSRPEVMAGAVKGATGGPSRVIALV